MKAAAFAIVLAFAAAWPSAALTQDEHCGAYNGRIRWKEIQIVLEEAEATVNEARRFVVEEGNVVAARARAVTWRIHDIRWKIERAEVMQECDRSMFFDIERQAEAIAEVAKHFDISASYIVSSIGEAREAIERAVDDYRAIERIAALSERNLRNAARDLAATETDDDYVEAWQQAREAEYFAELAARIHERAAEKVNRAQIFESYLSTADSFTGVTAAFTEVTTAAGQITGQITDWRAELEQATPHGKIL